MGKDGKMASEEHIRELLNAEKEGRLVILPCSLGSPVYTIEEDYCACDNCEFKDEAEYDTVFRHVTCHPSAERNCPYIVKETIAEGFEVRLDENGKLITSNPGTWRWEGLKEVYSDNDVWYTSKEEAERVCAEKNRERIS